LAERLEVSEEEDFKLVEEVAAATPVESVAAAAAAILKYVDKRGVVVLALGEGEVVIVADFILFSLNLFLTYHDCPGRNLTSN